ncbi:hypothetical protein [Clostridium sp. ZS2-4]|uniref:hypothetical protein n=1 Tax=Clostridium sp. ZS2-4 TaxID=2987703 RepID=UPI00227A73A4|nr:hypothetical protein [Clostridium sp. ZS2-4]MCY6354832.1 hypothetical protein [Clostridium sp. ZS2-4]
MKFNKLDFILYIKTGNLNWILYLMASLIILIPIYIVLITDVHFSASFSKISIGIALIFVIIGKLITLIKKKKGDKSIPGDIGIIIGILIVFISHVLK